MPASTFSSNGLEAVALEGELKKKSIFSAWKTCYCVISQGQLLQYSHKPTTSKNDHKLAVQLKDANIQIIDATSFCGKKNTIGIFVLGQNPMIYLADSEAEQKKWIEELKKQTHASQHQTKQQEDQLIQTLEAVLDPTVITNDNIIIGFNESASKMFGYAKSEAIGQNVKILMPRSYATFHDAYIERYYRTGHKKLIGLPRSMLALKKNGETLPVTLSLGEVPLKHSTDKKYFVAVFRETSLMDSRSSPELLSSDVSRRNSYNNNNKSSSLLAAKDEDTDDSESTASSMDEPAHQRSLHDVKSAIPPVPVKSNTNTSSGSSSDQILNSNEFVVSANTEIHSLLKYSSLKMNGKMHEFVDTMRKLIKDEYEELEKRFQVVSDKLQIMETENNHLINQINSQNESIKNLEEELDLYRKSSEKYTLLQVLQNDVSFQAFFDFCKGQGSHEPLLCYKEIELFRKKFRDLLSDQEMEQARRDAEIIFNKYIVHGAPLEVNISSELRSALRDRIKDRPGRGVFDVLQNEILLMLKENYLQRFFESGIGKATLTLLGH